MGSPPTNPWKDKLKPPGPTDPDPDPKAEVSENAGQLCALMGVMPMIQTAQGRIQDLRSQAPEVVNVIPSCVGPRCVFYNQEEEDCSIRLGMDALHKLGKNPMLGGS